jgi:serine/threonine protein kinase
MSLQIGQYRVVSELGAGGMGVVYKAVDVQINREVALKRLRSEFAASDAVLERFRREAQLQGRLNHPGIAQIYALTQTEEAFCIVMEFVNGVSLSKLLPLDWTYAVQIVLQTLDALEFAHGSGVLHRDVKPENILLDRRGIVKVMDFGIAHAVGAERLTREKSLIGTIEYMSPERILSQPVDGRSDLYAVGIVFFELLAGRLPSDTLSEFDLMRWHVDTVAPPVTDFAQVPARVAEIIARSIAKKPDDRFRSCQEMAAALREFIAGSGLQLPALVTLVPRSHKEKLLGEVELQACFQSVRELIERNELSAAQRQLSDLVRDHPGNPPVESMHSLVRAVRLPSTRLQGAPDQVEAGSSLQLLRIIAAERCGDQAAAESILKSALSNDTQSAILRILAARQAHKPVPIAAER